MTRRRGVGNDDRGLFVEPDLELAIQLMSATELVHCQGGECERECQGDKSDRDPLHGRLYGRA